MESNYRSLSPSDLFVSTLELEIHTATLVLSAIQKGDWMVLVLQVPIQDSSRELVGYFLRFMLHKFKVCVMPFHNPLSIIADCSQPIAA